MKSPSVWSWLARSRFFYNRLICLLIVLFYFFSLFSTLSFCSIHVLMPKEKLKRLNPALLDCNQLSSLSTNHDDKTSWSPTRFEENKIIFNATIGRNENAGIIYQSSEIQDHNMFFPGGYLHVFATAKPDGVPLSWVLHKLASDDLVAILKGLLKLAK